MLFRTGFVLVVLFLLCACQNLKDEVSIQPLTEKTAQKVVTIKSGKIFMELTRPKPEILRFIKKNGKITANANNLELIFTSNTSTETLISQLNQQFKAYIVEIYEINDVKID